MTPQEIASALAAPFPASSVNWKPKRRAGNRCLAVPYLDARAVQDRLDQVVGLDGWEDAYLTLPSGSVVCTLKVRIGDTVVSKTDAGSSPPDMEDAGDAIKGAFSDALKRAAARFGIGRYLYHVEGVWTDYDERKKCIALIPQLPRWALPPSEGMDVVIELMSKIREELVRAWPGTTKASKLAKQATLVKHFGSKRWQSLEQLPVDRLREGLARLQVANGQESSLSQQLRESIALIESENGIEE